MAGETILVVDDEETNIAVLIEWLELLGYEVVAARSGEEALEIYEDQGQDIDLIILDMVMPGLEGEDVYYRLQEMDPDVRVIVISGYALEDKVTRLVEAGAFTFLKNLSYGCAGAECGRGFVSAQVALIYVMSPFSRSCSGTKA